MLFLGNEFELKKIPKYNSTATSHIKQGEKLKKAKMLYIIKGIWECWKLLYSKITY